MNWNAKRIEIGSANLILSTRLCGFSRFVLLQIVLYFFVVKVVFLFVFIASRRDIIFCYWNFIVSERTYKRLASSYLYYYWNLEDEKIVSNNSCVYITLYWHWYCHSYFRLLSNLVSMCACVSCLKTIA